MVGWELPGIDVVDEAAVVAVGPGAVEGESLEHQLSSLFYALISSGRILLSRREQLSKMFQTLVILNF